MAWLRERRFQEGWNPRLLQARWWLTRPMRDRHDLPQRSHGKVCSGQNADGMRFLRRFLFFASPTSRLSSNWVVVWWTVLLHESRSAACVAHWRWSVPQRVRDLLREFLYRFRGAPLSQLWSSTRVNKRTRCGCPMLAFLPDLEGKVILPCTVSMFRGRKIYVSNDIHMTAIK